MKISAIQNTYNKSIYVTQKRDMKFSQTNHPYELRSVGAAFYYPLNISFGISNAGDMKKLFSYGLPSIYSGKEMIDPKKISRMIKNKAYNLPSRLLFKQLEPFEKCLGDIEEEVYTILKDRSEIYPDKTLKDLMDGIVPTYKKRLRKKQAPIFHNLIKSAYKLPEAYRYKFKQFMHETEDKLNDIPVAVPFSVGEFQYKLLKMKEDVDKLQIPKGTRVINKLLKESERFSKRTNFRTIDNQNKIINFMELIQKRSVLKDYEQLIKLLKDSKSRINGEKIIVPFSRKAFIFDLDRIIQDLSDKDLRYELISIASSLPTSSENKSAYITKFSRESSEKLLYRLLWPFFASVEHLLPKSCGGEDKMANFAGATTRENSKRGNIDFLIQMKRIPKIKIYCQQYVDRLIEHAKSRVFKKEKIDINYIEQFCETIKTLSNNKIKLNTSKLYEQRGL